MQGTIKAFTKGAAKVTIIETKKTYEVHEPDRAEVIRARWGGKISFEVSSDNKKIHNVKVLQQGPDTGVNGGGFNNTSKDRTKNMDMIRMSAVKSAVQLLQIRGMDLQTADQVPKDANDVVVVAKRLEKYMLTGE
jgi:hypothetical protein